MLKILIVEDEHEKRRLIASAVLGTPGINEGDVEYAADVTGAKRAIRRTRFDLVILDINLPEKPDAFATPGAGLQVVSFIKNNNAAKAPSYLVGMTAYDESANVASDEFASPLWKLVRFSYTENGWKQSLELALEYLVQKHRPPYVSDGKTYHTDLAIFTALDEELEAILALNGNWREEAVAHDHARYFVGTFPSDVRPVRVVAVAAPRMGMPPAAVTAAKLISTFRPRTLAITGICAGVRGKTEVGDILIADPCFDWGSGKWVREEATSELRFRPAPYQWRLDERLRAGARAVATAGLMGQIHQRYEDAKPDSAPRVIVDAMASGASVLQAAQLVDDVRDQHKNLVGVEMESYAVFTAAEYASEPRPACIAIKSVCDFGDETKADEAHAYASHTSAQFLYAFATEFLSNEDID
ncbi:5'-methylthioadenosine/S-adenosylhomocysteine nucleosidase [Caballeronia catudaia]|uniref:5'-methylthioadenosine/S-adenosylhomocysteine nucleosidase n=1 Tax=Caballeronia catudaia TaxID=1777136 RepID=A0A158DFA6_9BURK|nr:response regulator [Caballeronia catudaia]SAK92946.1 5'-methylthioadenosine/S-adenosylhomocysteine nucleosidase [Caballeronia catudaia]